MKRLIFFEYHNFYNKTIQKLVIFGLFLVFIANLIFWGLWFNEWKVSANSAMDPLDKDHYALDNLMNATNIVSTVIIGSGPAGLMAAVYSARAARDTLVLEGNKPGGLLMDTTEVENWPGEISIDGPHIIAKTRKQAQKFGARFLHDAVASMDTKQWPFMITTENGVVLRALSIIIATGATPKHLGIAGESENWGMGVSSCAVCDAPFFKNRRVLVVGGGDSAVEEAIQLAPYAKEVTIMVRKGAMRAAPRMQARLSQYSGINVMYNVELIDIVSDATGVIGAHVRHHDRGTTEYQETDGIFLAIGHNPNTLLVRDNVSVDENGYIKVQGRSQKTSVPGIFAAGDVEDTVYRQAGVAAASGIKAALDADMFLAECGITPQVIRDLGARMYTIASDSSISVPYFENENDLLAYNKGLVLVCFVTQTCSACAQMIPMIEELAQSMPHIRFAFIDADKSNSLTAQYFVHKVPCLIALRDGSLLLRYSGGVTKKELMQFIETLEDKKNS